MFILSMSLGGIGRSLIAATALTLGQGAHAQDQVPQQNPPQHGPTLPGFPSHPQPAPIFRGSCPPAGYHPYRRGYGGAYAWSGSGHATVNQQTNIVGNRWESHVDNRVTIKSGGDVNISSGGGAITIGQTPFGGRSSNNCPDPVKPADASEGDGGSKAAKKARKAQRN